MLILREMQVKTIRKYHFTPVRMGIIKKNTNVGKDVEKREPSYTASKNVNLWKTVWRFFKKLKLPYNPEIPLLGFILKKQKHLFKRHLHPNVHHSII